MELAHFVLDQGPQRVAPFSHAVRAGNFLFVTGQMPTLLHDNSRCVEGGVEAQLRQVMSNLQGVVAGCGGDWRRVVMARVYLAEFARDYPVVNGIWEAYFAPGALPARTTVGVTALALGALVEVDMVVAF